MSKKKDDSQPSFGDRRDVAREKARQLRAEQKKKDRRNKWIIQGSLIVIVVAIVAAVFLVITSTIRPAAPGPLNMLSDGIKIGENFDAVKTSALQPSAEPVPSASNELSSVLDIRIYVDYMCPVCGMFEKANGEQIKKLVKDGAATVEIHPVAILDRLSMGTKYSTRAANAAACVANYSPNNFFAFNELLFKHQPEEDSSGLSDGRLIELAKETGVDKYTNIVTCIETQEFKNWVAGATDRFNSNPFPNAATQPEKHGTPIIYVNGQLFPYTYDEVTGEFDPAQFFAFFTKVLGANFSEDAAPVPSPSPSPSVAP